jgi:hypothetical protein
MSNFDNGADRTIEKILLDDLVDKQHDFGSNHEGIPNRMRQFRGVLLRFDGHGGIDDGNRVSDFLQALDSDWFCSCPCRHDKQGIANERSQKARSHMMFLAMAC